MPAVGRAGRGKWAGEALVRACAERAAAIEGVNRPPLSTRARSPAAHRIHERPGFVRTPERDWSPVPTAAPPTYALELRVLDW
ncbi:hypothetical protein [Streptomyces goshikiensis]|uniref:hypothetical protein n=1 Tax=Streptomyces goshikiensis TaxID=1942 RepID=UPI0036DD3E45